MAFSAWKTFLEVRTANMVRELNKVRRQPVCSSIDSAALHRGMSLIKDSLTKKPIIVCGAYKYRFTSRKSVLLRLIAQCTVLLYQEYIQYLKHPLLRQREPYASLDAV